MAAIDCAAIAEDLPVDRSAAAKDKAPAPQRRKGPRIRPVYSSEHVVRLGPVRLLLLRQRLLLCRAAIGCLFAGRHPRARRRGLSQGGTRVLRGCPARLALESGAD